MMGKNNPPVRDGFDALQPDEWELARRKLQTEQTGKFRVKRDVKIDVFDLGHVPRAEDAMREFLAGCTDPGWEIVVMMGDPMHVTIVAIKETLEQDA